MPINDGSWQAIQLSQPRKPARVPARPPRRNLYISFQGKGPNRQDGFAVLCGDNPPVIAGGYANWQTVPRPLLRGVTVFQGYDPVTMTLELRFGIWTSTFAWQTDDDAGRSVEADIEKLEWMAGANFVAGPSPYVYLNTYDASGATTPLIPLQYQQTAGVSGATRDTSLWPWVISGGITWGASYRNSSGYRIKQDATLTVMNYQGFTAPPQKSTSGAYFTSVPGRDTMLLIASAPSSHALFPEALATRIQADPKNNPMKGSRISLQRKSLRWPIKHGARVWVPGHQT